MAVDPDDVAALIEAMSKLADPATAKAFGLRAAAHSSLFTWQAVAERVLRGLRPAGLDISGLATFLEPTMR